VTGMVTHGNTRGRDGGRRRISAEYRIWAAMKSRVTATGGEHFENYVRRGIIVCDACGARYTCAKETLAQAKDQLP
jgi:hypothetical protein